MTLSKNQKFQVAAIALFSTLFFILFFVSNSTIAQAGNSVEVIRGHQPLYVGWNVFGGYNTDSRCLPLSDAEPDLQNAWMATGGATLYGNVSLPKPTVIGTSFFRCTHASGASDVAHLVVRGCTSPRIWDPVSKSCVNPPSGPDLVPRNLVVPASAVAGGNITVTANARNRGLGGTGVGFNNEFKYSWNNSGGPFSSFAPSATFAKAALAASSSAPQDSHTFSFPTTVGTLYIQYCVDTDDVVDEGSNESNCAVSGGIIVSAAPLPECSDGRDNDDPEDTLVDFGQDPGCESATDPDETDGVVSQPDLTAVNTSPAAGQSFNNPASITFTGTLTNSNAVTAVGQNVWADVEIDWNQSNCAVATAENVQNAGGPWTSLGIDATQGMSRTLTKAASELRNGTHCYRMIADRDNLVTESDDTNNAGPWRSFTVSNLPECSDGINNDGLGGTDYPGDLDCTSDDDDDESSNPVVTGTLTVDPGSVTTGGTTEVEWTTTNASSCSVVRVVSTDNPSAGSWTGTNNSGVTSNPLTINTTFRLECDGVLLDAEAVAVNPVANPDLRVTPRVVPPGTEVTLEWDTNNNDEALCTLTGGGIASDVLTTDLTGDVETGSYQITVTRTTTFTLNCGGGRTDSVTVTVIGTGFET